MPTQEQYARYRELTEHLAAMSKDICADNECTEDEHNCEFYAYFDLDCSTKAFELVTICQSDYCNRVYDIAVPMPFHGNTRDLLDAFDYYGDWDQLRDKMKAYKDEMSTIWPDPMKGTD